MDLLAMPPLPPHRQTLRHYFRQFDGGLHVSVGVIGTNEGNETLKDLAVRFVIGGDEER